MNAEKSQIMQIAADIRSLEFEIRLLSGAKTVQHVTRQGMSTLIDGSYHKSAHFSGARESGGQHSSGAENTSAATGGLSGIKKRLMNCFAQDDPLEHDRTVRTTFPGKSYSLSPLASSLLPSPLLSRLPSFRATVASHFSSLPHLLPSPPRLIAPSPSQNISEAILEDEDSPASAVPQPLAAPSVNLDRSPGLSADSSSETILDSAPRTRAVVDRPGLQTVKRNLVSFFEDRDAARLSSSSSSHHSSSLLRSESEPASAAPGPMRCVHGSPGGVFEKADGAVGEWTDVDLGRWATVSKRAAVSPVASRATAASPMPVVLQYRVLGRRASPGGEMCVETLEMDESLDRCARPLPE